MKAAIYLRISQDATGEALGVSRQLEDCNEHARILGWEVVEVYTDNDISATSGKVRPGYRRMLADIDAGKVEGIIAWHADRLYRKAADLGELVDVCKRNNTQIATVRAGTIDLTTPTGRLVAGLLAQVATYEGEAKSDRWRRSWRQGREAGRPAKTGSRLFGYTRDGEVIEEEAAIAKRMVDDVLGGVGILNVARWLEEEGIPTTRDTVWRPGTVRQYLKNPRIAGWSTLNGEIVGEGQWTPLVDRATWEGLRAMLDARARPYVGRVSLLNGLIFCGSCGHRMVTSDARGKRTYRCPKRPGMPGCGAVSGMAAPIEEIVETIAQAKLADQEVRDRINALRAQPLAAQNEIAELELRVKELEAQLDEPGVPVATILRAIDRTKERQEKMLGDLAAAPRVPLPVQGGKWPDDLRRRRALVDLVVARVVLEPATTRGPFNPARVKVEPRD